MASGIKVILETPQGERVERTLKVVWSSECCLDLKELHTDVTGEDLKRAVAGEIARTLDENMIVGMLTELEASHVR